jgi:hypothetical protein
MSPSLHADAGVRSFVPASRPVKVPAADEFTRAWGRLWLNAIGDGMLSTVVVLVSLTAIEPVMRGVANLSAAAFPQHDPVVAIPIGLTLAVAVLVIVSAFVKSRANGVPVRSYFADTAAPSDVLR